MLGWGCLGKCGYQGGGIPAVWYMMVLGVEGSSGMGVMVYGGLMGYCMLCVVYGGNCGVISTTLIFDETPLDMVFEG